MNDGQKDSQASVHSVSVQADKETDTGTEGPMNPSFIFLPMSKAIDEWWLTSKEDGNPSDKYSITSTGNGNVDLSRK